MVNGIKSTLKSLKFPELSSPPKREWSIRKALERRIPKPEQCYGMSTEEVKDTGLSIHTNKEVKNSMKKQKIARCGETQTTSHKEE